MNRAPLLFVAQLILFFQVVECAVYPSIQWSPENPLFDRNDSVIYVLPMSKVHIVCPNPTTVMKRVKDSPPKDELYQNLWIVSRESYERCQTDYNQGSMYLLRCDSPLTLKYYTLVFQRYSAVSNQVFIPGKEYYFIATSDGSRQSVNRKSGGNCQHRNMKLRITVCINNKDPRCNLQRATTMTTKTRTTTTATMTSKTSTWNTTKITSAASKIQATTPSTNPSSTTLRTTDSSTHVPIAKVRRRPTTSPTSEPCSSVVMKSTETPRIAHVSSDDRIVSKHSGILDAVSELNWIIIVPLMACLLLSLIGNILLVCRLRLRQNEYDLNEKEQKTVEADPVKQSETPKTQSRVDKAALLLFRRSADVTDV